VGGGGEGEDGGPERRDPRRGEGALEGLETGLLAPSAWARAKGEGPGGGAEWEMTDRFGERRGAGNKEKDKDTDKEMVKGKERGRDREGRGTGTGDRIGTGPGTGRGTGTGGRGVGTGSRDRGKDIRDGRTKAGSKGRGSAHGPWRERHPTGGSTGKPRQGAGTGRARSGATGAREGRGGQKGPGRGSASASWEPRGSPRFRRDRDKARPPRDSPRRKKGPGTGRTPTPSPPRRRRSRTPPPPRRRPLPAPPLQSLGSRRAGSAETPRAQGRQGARPEGRRGKGGGGGRLRRAAPWKAATRGAGAPQKSWRRWCGGPPGRKRRWEPSRGRDPCRCPRPHTPAAARPCLCSRWPWRSRQHLALAAGQPSQAGSAAAGCRSGSRRSFPPSACGLLGGLALGGPPCDLRARLPGRSRAQPLGAAGRQLATPCSWGSLNPAVPLQATRPARPLDVG